MTGNRLLRCNKSVRVRDIHPPGEVEPFLSSDLHFTLFDSHSTLKLCPSSDFRPSFESDKENDRLLALFRVRCGAMQA